MKPTLAQDTVTEEPRVAWLTPADVALIRDALTDARLYRLQVADLARLHADAIMRCAELPGVADDPTLQEQAEEALRDARTALATAHRVATLATAMERYERMGLAR